jgi:hypothetical protein
MYMFLLYFVLHFDYEIIAILDGREASVTLKAPLSFAMIHPLISIAFYKLCP